MKKINKKTLVLLIAAALLLTITVSGTVAYLVDSTGAVRNVFEPGRVQPNITESFNGQTKNDVKIQNTGNVDAYIRAMVVVTWQNSAGEVYPVAPVAGTDYTISYGSNWEQAGAYWYYNGIVKGKTETTTDSTTALIESCSPVSGKEPAEGYTLHVEILAQAIQADGMGVSTAQAAFAKAAAGN